jgi:DNA-binding NtrC family response regulator
MTQPVINQQTRSGMLTIAASLVYESGITLARAKEEFTRETIKFYLTQCKGNQCKVARCLGIHRNTLARAMRMLGIESSSQHWRGKYRDQQEHAMKIAAMSASGSSSVQAALHA